MPGRIEIQQEILVLKGTAQDLVRRRYLKQLHAYTKRDTILYASDFLSAKAAKVGPGAVSVTTQDVQGFMSALHGLKGNQLDLILHSPGGSLEAAEQVVQYLRSKYQHIRVIVPQNAMSAATMIACACEEIIMGKQSAIGPTDPQITFPTPTGLFTVSAQALLDEFEQAKAEVIANRAISPIWVSKVKNYPPGILTTCQQTITLAKQKVEAWLITYMFKDQPDGAAKAARIAKWLGETENHKTHGRPIGIATAQAEGLSVTALEKDPVLQDLVLSVYHATAVTFEVSSCLKFVENQDGRGWFINLPQ